MAAVDRTIHVALKDQPTTSPFAAGCSRTSACCCAASTRAARRSSSADTNLPPHYLAQLRESLQAEGYSPHTISVPPGEEQKAIDNVVRMYDQILPMKVDRHTPIIAVRRRRDSAI